MSEERGRCVCGCGHRVRRKNAEGDFDHRTTRKPGGVCLALQVAKRRRGEVAVARAASASTASAIAALLEVGGARARRRLREKTAGLQLLARWAAAPAGTAPKTPPPAETALPRSPAPAGTPPAAPARSRASGAKPERAPAPVFGPPHAGRSDLQKWGEHARWTVVEAHIGVTNSYSWLASLVALSERPQVRHIFSRFVGEDRRTSLFLAFAKHAAALACTVAGDDVDKLAQVFRKSAPEELTFRDADCALVNAIGAMVT